MYDGFIMPANFATFGRNRKHFYLVNQDKQGITVYDLEAEGMEKVRRSLIDGSVKRGSPADEYVEVVRKGNITLERTFNFEIKGIVTDKKDSEEGDIDGLVLITDEDTVYYTNKGSIVTYLPYKNRR